MNQAKQECFDYRMRERINARAQQLDGLENRSMSKQRREAAKLPVPVMFARTTTTDEEFRREVARQFQPQSADLVRRLEDRQVATALAKQQAVVELPSQLPHTELQPTAPDMFFVAASCLAVLGGRDKLSRRLSSVAAVTLILSLGSAACAGSEASPTLPPPGVTVIRPTPTPEPTATATATAVETATSVPPTPTQEAFIWNLPALLSGMGGGENGRYLEGLPNPPQAVIDTLTPEYIVLTARISEESNLSGPHENLAGIRLCAKNACYAVSSAFPEELIDRESGLAFTYNPDESRDGVIIYTRGGTETKIGFINRIPDRTGEGLHFAALIARSDATSYLAWVDSEGTVVEKIPNVRTVASGETIMIDYATGIATIGSERLEIGVPPYEFTQDGETIAHEISLWLTDVGPWDNSESWKDYNIFPITYSVRVAGINIDQSGITFLFTWRDKIFKVRPDLVNLDLDAETATNGILAQGFIPPERRALIISRLETLMANRYYYAFFGMYVPSSSAQTEISCSAPLFTHYPEVATACAQTPQDLRPRNFSELDSVIRSNMIKYSPELMSPDQADWTENTNIPEVPPGFLAFVGIVK